MKDNWKQLSQESTEMSHLIQYIKAGKWTTTTIETRAVCHQTDFQELYDTALYVAAYHSTSAITVIAVTVTW